ncbi:MAG: hypothetical protein PVI30_00510 [Myxococcales bacterium]|jgi:hypothetical protein
MSVFKLVNEHVDALLSAAQQAGHDREAVARALLDRVMGIYRESRGVADIRCELDFISETLDDDEEYPFMRP